MLSGDGSQVSDVAPAFDMLSVVGRIMAPQRRMSES